MVPSFGGGIFGTFMAILFFILMLPLLIIISLLGVVWLIYIKWKLKKQFQKMADQMDNGDFEQYSPQADTKRVEVTELPPDSVE